MKTYNMVKVISLIISFLIFFSCSGELETQDSTWPQFRGFNSFGLAHENAKPPVQFGPDQNLLWKVALPIGHSSPCIWDDNIFLTAYIEDEKELNELQKNLRKFEKEREKYQHGLLRWNEQTKSAEANILRLSDEGKTNIGKNEQQKRHIKDFNKEI